MSRCLAGDFFDLELCVERQVERIDDPKEWTVEKIKERAADINSDTGPEGNFDD